MIMGDRSLTGTADRAAPEDAVVSQPVAGDDFDRTLVPMTTKRIHYVSHGEPRTDDQHGIAGRDRGKACLVPWISDKARGFHDDRSEFDGRRRRKISNAQDNIVKKKGSAVVKADTSGVPTRISTADLCNTVTSLPRRAPQRLHETRPRYTAHSRAAVRTHC